MHLMKSIYEKNLVSAKIKALKVLNVKNWRKQY